REVCMSAKSREGTGMVSHRLRSLEIIGGFLDGQRFDLADGLNCIIGARGTGKTTVVEFVRYAMDAMPGDKDARKRIEGLVERNLQGGRVRLGIETKDGLAYVISRAVGDEPIVLAEDGSPTELTLRSGGLFRVDVYSQNEVESIADQAESQLDLIDNFESARIAAIEQQIRSTKTDLAANANNILPLQGKMDGLKEELNQLPGIEEKLKAYGSEGGQDSDAINQAHALKSLRDRETRAVETAKELLEELLRDLDNLKGRIAVRAESLAAKELLEGPNAPTLRQIFDGLRACGQDVDKHIQSAQDRIKTEQGQIAARVAKLNTAHKEQELKFRALIEKHKEAQGKATERSRLEKVRNDLLAKKREHDDLAQRVNVLRGQRTALIQKLSEHRDERFRVRKQIVDRINSNVKPEIRVSIEQYGNPAEYRKLLEEAIKPASVKRGVVAQKVVNAFWPADLTEVIKDRNHQPLIDKAELNPDQAQKVMEVLTGANVLFDLETVELIDLPKIELSDRGNYKETNVLSTGQKCNTILPILLLDSDNPLLIDQPEDNLDNSFVFNTVVKNVRQVKQRRQLIFVTHNPNIPVLGEAEKVFVLDSNGTTAYKKDEGTVDHCKDDIVTLLEGGEDAFKQRKARYSY
ncbi:MAG: AAA family ATPase, partial [Gemmatimonadales bacterium]